ncbi:MAG: cell wall hydrolase [Clostridia bacterium]|nr:cell wall hydrolase [Clostridia bacterium]
MSNRVARAVAAAAIATSTLFAATPILASPAHWHWVSGDIRPGLSYGDAGPAVRTLQGDLWHFGFNPGPADGYFGDRTLAALQAFQRRFGLPVTGVLDAATFAKILALGGWGPARGTAAVPADKPATPAPAPASGATGAGVQVSPAEVELLVHLVHAEANTEPLEGQIAVAAVVLNRVKSPLFPNTVRDVIYQPYQFESVGNYFFTTDPPTAQNREAVRRALAGEDPTHGALYFFAPAMTSNAFLWSLIQTAHIGNHIFGVPRS